MNVEARIMTASGEFFYFLEPELYTFDIEAIAHSLSNQCRWTGNCKSFYSIAQHSVLVSLHTAAGEALAGLLHDATESVLGDCSSPLKKLLPTYKMMELRAEAHMAKQFGINFPFHSSIKLADIRAMQTEKRDLWYDGCWPATWHEEFAPFDEHIWPVPPKEAFKLFMSRWEELTK